jgi:conjugative transfer signal peptidase TraF
MARARGYVGAGYCPGGYGHLMKRLVASKDDTVIINAEGVLINDRLLPSSAAIQKDGLGRALPHYEGSWVLGDYEVLLMSDKHKGGFDGRYFGSIQRSQIEGVLRPLFTW